MTQASMGPPYTGAPAPAPVSAAPLSGPVIRLAMRSLFGRARVALLVALPVLLLGLAVLLGRLENVTPSDAETFLRTFGIGVVIPVVVLVATTTLFSSEFDDGSIIYLLVKPISRLSLVLSKAVVILAAVLLFGVLPLALAALILHGGADRLALAALAGGAVSGAAYAGIFTALATVLRRSIVGCLAYWLIWESTIASLVGPTRWLSARSWGMSTVQEIATIFGDGKPPIPLWFAALASVLALVAGVLVAARRLVSMTLSDD